MRSPGRADLERARWGLGFKHHRGLLQTTYGKALAANVAWSIYVLSAVLTTVHQNPGSRCHIQPRPLQPFPQDHLIWTSLPPTPPPSPALLPTGPSYCSWFSCLVYSSSYPQSSLSRWSFIGLFVFQSLLWQLRAENKRNMQ